MDTIPYVFTALVIIQLLLFYSLIVVLVDKGPPTGKDVIIKCATDLTSHIAKRKKKQKKPAKMVMKPVARLSHSVIHQACVVELLYHATAL